MLTKKTKKRYNKENMTYNIWKLRKLTICQEVKKMKTTMKIYKLIQKKDKEYENENTDNTHKKRKWKRDTIKYARFIY